MTGKNEKNARLAVIVSAGSDKIAENIIFRIKVARGMVIVKVLFPDCKFKWVAAQSN